MKPDDDTSWMDAAPCRGLTEVFFPDNATTAEVQEAKRICRTCPYVEPCKEYGLRYGGKDGVWGGLSDRERRAERRRRRGLPPVEPIPAGSCRPCNICGATFVYRSTQQLYCGKPACKREAQNRRNASYRLRRLEAS